MECSISNYDIFNMNQEAAHELYTNFELRTLYSLIGRGNDTNVKRPLEHSDLAKTILKSLADLTSKGTDL